MGSPSLLCEIRGFTIFSYLGLASEHAYLCITSLFKNGLTVWFRLEPSHCRFLDTRRHLKQDMTWYLYTNKQVKPSNDLWGGSYIWTRVQVVAEQPPPIWLMSTTINIFYSRRWEMSLIDYNLGRPKTVMDWYVNSLSMHVTSWSYLLHASLIELHVKVTIYQSSKSKITRCLSAIEQS